MDTQVAALSAAAKRYGRHTVFENVTLTVERGACIALTGVNGCGKSTMLRVLAGLTAVSEGLAQRAPGVKVSYMPDTFPRLNLTLQTYLRALERIDCQDTARLARAFHLDGAMNAPIRAFSKGMLQKVCAIQALSSGADLLLLDEPLSGQDEQSQAAFVDAVRQALSRGAAVALACHEKNLIDALGARAYRLRDGHLFAADCADIACRACLCARCALNGSDACAKAGRRA